MLQALALGLDELGDRTIRLGRFQQLDFGIAHRQEGHPDLLVGDSFGAVQCQAENIGVYLEGLVEIGDSDADMVNSSRHAFPPQELK